MDNLPQSTHPNAVIDQWWVQDVDTSDDGGASLDLKAEVTTVPAETTDIASHEAFVTSWTDRANQLHSRDEEQPTDSDDGRSLHFDHLTLYHGSTNTSIEVFEPAEERTVTMGLYNTYDPREAIAYAVQRTRQGSRGLNVDKVRDPANFSPVLYELIVENTTLLDLRTRDSIEKLLADFSGRISQWISENSINHEERSRLWSTSMLIDKATDIAIHPSERLRAMAARSDLLTTYLLEKGYNGVIVLEGGEGAIGDHESWVIFDPAQAKVTAETSFRIPAKR